jgi:precorrin-2/cobalt-factor-2 C20-methyltransferase
VTSFCAAAAALDIALCEGAEPMHIIPASYGGDFSGLDGTRVLMKSGKAFGGIAESLRASGDSDVFMVRRASMKDEKAFHPADKLDDNEDYFSIIVVKKK